MIGMAICGWVLMALATTVATGMSWRWPRRGPLIIRGLLFLVAWPLLLIGVALWGLGRLDEWFSSTP